jgi:hypothetical protein
MQYAHPPKRAKYRVENDAQALCFGIEDDSGRSNEVFFF